MWSSVVVNNTPECVVEIPNVSRKNAAFVTEFPPNSQARSVDQ